MTNPLDMNPPVVNPLLDVAVRLILYAGVVLIIMFLWKRYMLFQIEKAKRGQS